MPAKKRKTVEMTAEAFGEAVAGMLRDPEVEDEEKQCAIEVIRSVGLLIKQRVVDREAMDDAILIKVALATKLARIELGHAPTDEEVDAMTAIVIAKAYDETVRNCSDPKARNVRAFAVMERIQRSAKSELEKFFRGE